MKKHSLPKGEETFWFISVMKPGNCCWGAGGWKLCCAGLLNNAIIESFDIFEESLFALLNPSFKSAPKKLLWSLLMLLAAVLLLLLLLTGAELKDPKKSKSEEWLLELEEESPGEKQKILNGYKSKSKLDINLKKWHSVLE